MLRVWVFVLSTGNSLKPLKQEGCTISFVFQKAGSGCQVENGLNEIICVKGFAQVLGATVSAQET